MLDDIPVISKKLLDPAILPRTGSEINLQNLMQALQCIEKSKDTSGWGDEGFHISESAFRSVKCRVDRFMERSQIEQSSQILTDMFQRSFTRVELAHVSAVDSHFSARAHGPTVNCTDVDELNKIVVTVHSGSWSLFHCGEPSVQIVKDVGRIELCDSSS